MDGVGPNDKVIGEAGKCYQCKEPTTKLTLWSTQYIDPGQTNKIYKYICESCDAASFVGGA